MKSVKIITRMWNEGSNTSVPESGESTKEDPTKKESLKRRLRERLGLMWL